MIGDRPEKAFVVIFYFDKESRKPKGMGPFPAYWSVGRTAYVSEGGKIFPDIGWFKLYESAEEGEGDSGLPLMDNFDACMAYVYRTEEEAMACLFGLQGGYSASQTLMKLS